MTHSGSGPGRALSLPHSPSFTEYSSGTMADTAARVISELAHLDNYYDDVVLAEQTKSENSEGEEEEEDDDVSFEFPVPDFSPASASEIFNNGQIRPLYPLFNTDLVFADTDWRVDFNLHAENSDSIRLPLNKLMISERVSSITDSVSVSVSCSSSEADDLEGLAPDLYCEWSPSKQEMRRKSKSTGTTLSSSKRWKFRDLLYRSNSDGADAFDALSSKQRHAHNKKAPATGSTVEKAREIRESDRKRLGGPYRRDPVGFFARMNELSRTIQPF